MEIEAENNKYKLIENYREAFDKEMFLARYTDYYKDYDYIVGDIAYSKLRLKGFNKKNNKNFNQINDYLLLNSAFNCAVSAGTILLRSPTIP